MTTVPRVLAAAVVAAAVAAGVSLAAARPWRANGKEDRIPSGVRAELEARAVSILQREPVGRAIVTRLPGGPVTCSAHLLGTEPPASARPKALFVRATCATATASADVPVAIHLTGRITVDVPTDAESVGKDFPYRLRPLALPTRR